MNLMPKLHHGWTDLTHDIGKMTAIDHAAEYAPQDVGLDAKAVVNIWTAVEKLYDTGVHPAITVVIRRGGKIIMKRAIGAVSGTAPGDTGPLVPLSPDAPMSLFSASKAITSLLVHKLVEDGSVRLDEPVSTYIPEFSARGKHRVTVRELLAHRAGIPALPIEYPEPELLKHWDAIVAILCAAKPLDPTFRKQAYHALTGGFIIGEVVRRASGRELPDLLREWLAQPLGCKHLTYGLDASLRSQLPPNVCTGPKPFWPASAYIKSIIGVPFEHAVRSSNDDSFLSSVVPAGNICATADDASRVFQMLLNGGEFNGVRIFKPETVAEAIKPAGRIQIDRTIGIPLRYSAGFMLGESPVGLYGPWCRQAFGHLGFINVLCWADPERDISVALLNTGKSMAPSGLIRMAGVLGAISKACPKK